jgi:hypothetical protein
MPAYGWVVRDVSLEQYVGAIHPSKPAAGVALKAARLLEPRHTFELEELKPPAVSVTVTGALDPAAAALEVTSVLARVDDKH